MSSAHASHKSGGIKQSHDTGQLDSAATTPVANPEELLSESEGYPFNAQGTEVNPAATERPQEAAAQPQQSGDR
ncbi:MAG: hypothetical protein RBJ76_03710 [Stenomitos frigidus ULC029]